MGINNAIFLAGMIFAATNWTPLAMAEESRIDSNAEEAVIGTLRLEFREQREGSEEEVQRLEIAITDTEDAIASIDQEALTDEMRTLVGDDGLASMVRTITKMCSKSPSAHIEIKRQRRVKNWQGLLKLFGAKVKLGSTRIEVKCGGRPRKKSGGEEESKKQVSQDLASLTL